MVRPTKLTPEIQSKIDENISLGLTYALAASAAGITYQTLNQQLQRGQTEKSGKHYQFYQYIQKQNADAAKTLLENINCAAKAGNCQIYTWILDRRFPEDFGKRVYRKTNSVSDTKDETVEINVRYSDEIRNQILAKFDQIAENNKSLIN